MLSILKMGGIKKNQGKYECNGAEINESSKMTTGQCGQEVQVTLEVTEEKKCRKWYTEPRWIAMTLILACVALSVCTVFVYERFNVPRNSEEILIRYGSLFRTEEEQMEMEENLRNKLRKVQESRETLANQTCSFTCQARNYYQNSGQYDEVDGNHDTSTPSDGQLSRLRDSDSIISLQANERRYEYHGCCISYSEFFSPGRLRNKDGQWVRVVQFRNRRQYFVRDICRQARACTGCQCTQTATYHTAVVIDYVGGEDDEDTDLEDNIGRVTAEEEEMENFRLEMVKMDGACKCFNS